MRRDNRDREHREKRQERLAQGQEYKDWHWEKQETEETQQPPFPRNTVTTIDENLVSDNKGVEVKWVGTDFRPQQTAQAPPPPSAGAPLPPPQSLYPDRSYSMPAAAHIQGAPTRSFTPTAAYTASEQTAQLGRTITANNNATTQPGQQGGGCDNKGRQVMMPGKAHKRDSISNQLGRAHSLYSIHSLTGKTQGSTSRETYH